MWEGCHSRPPRRPFLQSCRLQRGARQPGASRHRSSRPEKAFPRMHCFVLQNSRTKRGRGGAITTQRRPDQPVLPEQNRPGQRANCARALTHATRVRSSMAPPASRARPEAALVTTAAKKNNWPSPSRVNLCGASKTRPPIDQPTLATTVAPTGARSHGCRNRRRGNDRARQPGECFGGTRRQARACSGGQSAARGNLTRGIRQRCFASASGRRSAKASPPDRQAGAAKSRRRESGCKFRDARAR